MLKDFPLDVWPYAKSDAKRQGIAHRTKGYHYGGGWGIKSGEQATQALTVESLVSSLHDLYAYVLKAL